MNENSSMTSKQYKAFLQLLKKNLVYTEQLEDQERLKAELQQSIETIRIMLED